MKIVETALPGVLVLEPKTYGDERGIFFESFNRRDFASAAGIDVEFVQDNHSCSVKNALRGLHYQLRHPQGKLVRVTAGEVFDVAVDMRRSSPKFGQHAAQTLSAENKRTVWIPPGFAHGFLVLSERVEFLYKTTDYWHREDERTVIWNDPDLNIAWPLVGEPLLSAKDKTGIRFADAESFP